MKLNTTKLLLSLTLVSVLSVPGLAVAKAGIDERVDRILREMGELLGNAESFSFRADVSFDEFISWEQEIQFQSVVNLTVRRPDRLNIVYNGENRQSRVVFDGEDLIFHDLFTNHYATMKAPGNIDGAIDQLFEKYDESVPIADLLDADPYAALIEGSDRGILIDRLIPDEAASYHLAFTGEVLDWQIWIDKGPIPLPRQLVITYKNEPGAPQYRARLSNWNLKPNLAEHIFEFSPPPESEEMEFLPIQEIPVEEEVQP